MSNRKTGAKEMKTIQTSLMCLVLLLILDHANAGSAAINTVQNVTQLEMSSGNSGVFPAGMSANVMCSVTEFMQKLRAPVMTGVIVGSFIMSVFGKLAWPSIAMAIVCTAMFFGAGEGIAEISVHKCI